MDEIIHLTKHSTSIKQESRLPLHNPKADTLKEQTLNSQLFSQQDHGQQSISPGNIINMSNKMNEAKWEKSLIIYRRIPDRST